MHISEQSRIYDNPETSQLIFTYTEKMYVSEYFSYGREMPVDKSWNTLEIDSIRLN